MFIIIILVTFQFKKKKIYIYIYISLTEMNKTTLILAAELLLFFLRSSGI